MAPAAVSALDKAIHDRDSNSANIDVLEKELQDNATTPLTEAEVTHLLSMIKTTQTDLMDIHKRIIHCSPADLDVHQNTYQLLFRKTIKLLGGFTGIKNSFPVSSTSSGTVPPPSGPPDIRLPRLELPSFDGSLQDWVSFRDMFVTAVHDNKTLSNSQKLTYLKSQLKGEAVRQISSLVISDANYDIAWKQLQDRYQNDRELLFSILRRFDNQPVVQSQSAPGLRLLVDVSRECIRSLDVLKLPTDHWDAILIFYILKKMDSSSKELWEQSLKDTSIPPLASLFDFLEQRARALAASGSLPPKAISKSNVNHAPYQGDRKARPQSPLVHHSISKPARKCKICPELHSIFKCQNFLDATIPQRMETIRRLNLCFNCLGDHRVTECTSTKGCHKCNAKHHTLLHKEAPASASSTPSIPQNEPPPQNFHTLISANPTTESPPVFDSVLATSIVLVPDHQGQKQPCRSFMDQGSNAHYITESCARRLKVPRVRYCAQSTGLGDLPVSSSSSYAMVTVCSRLNPSIEYHVKALIVRKISSLLPVKAYDHSTWSHLQDLPLADPYWYSPQKIDLLLGAEIFFAILTEGKKTGPTGAPTAINSEFGWLIGGGSNLSSQIYQPLPFATSSSTPTQGSSPNETTDQLLRQFWEIEELQPTRMLTKEEQDCENHFRSTHTRNEDGRFIVRLPLKSPPLDLGPSVKIAIRRLHSLERRFKSQPTLYEEYNTFMKEYESLGHMVEVPPVEVDNKKMCYIPHHFVTKDSSTTTKFRVVFDASAKTANGVSLNDTMMVGPTIQDNLIDILIRFRLHKVAFTADVAKMYRQILVAPEDANLQRIVWREDPSLPIKHYMLTTLTYGTAPASFLATRVLQETADVEKEILPVASKITQRDFYMDDLMSGEPTIPQALESQSQLLELVKKAGLTLRKWSSNSQELLDSLPTEFRETQSLLDLNPDSTIKTLGISWNPQADHFMFRVSCPDSHKQTTKRIILSSIAKLFDPLGWLSPVIITAKILMQALWKEELEWDDILPDHLQYQWTQFQTNLQALEEVKIPRFLFSDSPYSYPSLNHPSAHSQNDIKFCLVGFSDASEKAYSAVIYICAYGTISEPSISLVVAKTRVAPVKTVSLPRLELCGALLLADLMTMVKNAFRIDFHSISAWSDSTITLDWIQSHSSRWNTFVANRVTKIQNQIPPELWGHVCSEDNPADCASRGIYTSELINHNLWWHGPSWLKNGIPSSQPFRKTDPPTHEEERQVVKCHATVTIPFQLLDKFSSLTKLQRVTAYCLRFIRLCRIKRSSPQPKSKSMIATTISLSIPLTPIELEVALICLIKCVQQQHFFSEMQQIKKNGLNSKSNLFSLNPFIDRDNILRVGGRLNKSSLSPDQRNPTLLPRNSRLTELIINSNHVNHFHAGPQLLLSLIQRRFWIIRARDTIRFHLRRCITCTRLKSETMTQMMADLPSFRVQPARAFLKCGVDYAGPFLLRPIQPKSKTTIKGYIALFVCCTTKAVHLEVVSSLSTEVFLASLRRFVARRGCPTDIFSDCGTNFVGAKREMKELLDLVNSPSHNHEVANQLSRNGINWHLNPPSSPHFGGLFEAGVKSMKFHLRRTMGNQRWTFEMLTTATSQIEAILNSRPLTPSSSNPDDMTALTPGHFLIGCPLTSIPEPSLEQVKINRLSLWQHIQQITQHFWKRWSAEYLNQLQQRPKWMSGERKIQIGDLVIIKDDNLPPLQWHLGRITHLHPGTDSIVRVVTLKTSNGELKRPIVKLCLLPIDNNAT